MTYVHLVVHTESRSPRLTDPAIASPLWASLQAAFPAALGAVIMPDHLHVLTPARDAEEARRRLIRVTRSAMRRHRGLRFGPVPEERLETDRGKLARRARYLALNPIRAGLSTDPLEWTWSTLRDVVGAVARPWVTAAHLADALGRPREGFERWFQQYVAREDSVPPTALAPPVAARETRFADQPIVAVGHAAASALRAAPAAVRRRGPVRRLFLALAYRVGWGRAQLLAELCGVSRRAVEKARHRQPPQWLEAALLCLGDPRLRR
jgi:REP element-mobilizing transposase RayT